MTAKEAVEQLMSRNPSDKALTLLKKNGRLEDILYPEGRPDRQNRLAVYGQDKYERSSRIGADTRGGGREGGARIRSIGIDKNSDREKSWSRAGEGAAPSPSVGGGFLDEIRSTGAKRVYTGPAESSIPSNKSPIFGENRIDQQKQQAWGDGDFRDDPKPKRREWSSSLSPAKAAWEPKRTDGDLKKDFSLPSPSRSPAAYKPIPEDSLDRLAGHMLRHKHIE